MATPKKALGSPEPRIRPPGDRSPVLRPPEGEAGVADAAAPTPDAGAIPPEELALGGPPVEVAAPPPMEAPGSPPPGGAAVAEYEEGPNHGPLVAGLIVCGAVLLLGGLFLFWRNRDSRYWPA